MNEGEKERERNREIYRHTRMHTNAGIQLACRLEFGPTGHTHNGNDAVHAIHNNVAGNFTSLTLGAFQTHFAHSWRNDNNIPTAVIQEVQFDWKGRYKGA
jgi:hypothetical protein